MLPVLTESAGGSGDSGGRSGVKKLELLDTWPASLPLPGDPASTNSMQCTEGPVQQATEGKDRYSVSREVMEPRGH